MLAYGRSVTPSPRENVGQHLIEHQALQMEVARRLPPEHPVHAILGEHIMLTQQLLGMMQQSVGDAGTAAGPGGGTEGGGNGAAPFGGEGNVQTPAGAEGVQQSRVAGGSQGALTPYAGRRPAAVTR